VPLTPSQKRCEQRKRARRRAREANATVATTQPELNKKVALARIEHKIVADYQTIIGRRSSLLSAPIVDPTRNAIHRGLIQSRLLAEMEDAQSRKMNPRSMYQPDILHSQLVNLPRELHLPAECNMGLLREATSIVKEGLNLQFEPLSDFAALSALLARRIDTSAGAPYWAHREVVCFKYMTEGWKNFDEARFMRIKNSWETLGSPDPLEGIRDVAYPYTLNYRVEASDDPERCKHRIVWAAPLGTQILEAKYSVPIQLMLSQTFTKDDDEAHGSYFSYMYTDLLHQRLMHMRKTANAMGTPLYSLDYSHFDQSISAELIEAGFDALGVPRTGDGQVVRSRFVHKKLLNPWIEDADYIGMVPSGSTFTNLIDSAVNAIAATYVGLVYGTQVFVKVMGDDGVMIMDKAISASELQEATGTLGLVANESKQVIARSDEGFVYCQQYWGPEFKGPVPSLNKMANSLGRVDTLNFKVPFNEDTEILRSLQILQQARNHPLFPLLVWRVASATGSDGRPLLAYRERVPRALQQLQNSTGQVMSVEDWGGLEDNKYLDEYIVGDVNDPAKASD